MNSKRFPGKVLRKIKAKTILDLVIERVKKSKSIDEIIVLTSNNSKDNDICKHCEIKKIKYFRGSENDVLLRFHKASLIFKASHYLRINSDCPFIDWNLIDHSIEIASKAKDLDYVATILSNTFPVGQHIEVFTREALSKADKFATKSIEREHVTPYIYNNKDIFKLFSVKSNIGLSHIRLTIDYPKDLLMAENLLNKCNSDLPEYNEIISILEKYPEISKINDEYKKAQFIDLN